LAKKLDHWLNSEKALQEHIDNTSKPFRAGVGIYYFEEELESQ